MEVIWEIETFSVQFGTFFIKHHGSEKPAGNQILKLKSFFHVDKFLYYYFNSNWVSWTPWPYTYFYARLNKSLSS